MSGIVNPIGRSSASNMIDALSASLNSELKSVQHSSKLFGPGLTSIIDRQPQPLVEGLTGVRLAGSKHADICRALCDDLSSIPKNMDPLREYEREIVGRTGRMREASLRATKLVLEAERMESQTSTSPAQKEKTTATRERANSAATLSRELDESEGGQCVEVKKMFVRAAAAHLGSMAECRAKACLEMCEAAREMRSHAEGLGDYEDSVVAALQERIEALEHKRCTEASALDLLKA